jgi:hypothetical protein
MTVVSYSSLTRISDLDSKPYEVARIPKEDWDTGDYVVGEITGSSRRSYTIELTSGRMINPMPGDHVVGAFGNRAATLEGVGTWSEIEDNRMNAMTSAGLFGAITSLSHMIPSTVDLTYLGHVVRNGEKVCMTDFAIPPTEGIFNVPTILLVGTSMSAGKTTTGRLVVHELEKVGKKVVGTKLTGAGRYRDVLSFRDAGASAIYDFVDAGLPSTVVPENVFRDAIRPLLHKIASLEPDVVIVEAGASPLEPYNGATAIDELGDNIRCTILCASDPYAVVGVEKAFGLRPDLVSGPATSTSAAIDLVHKLTGVEAINVMDTSCLPALRKVLKRTLNI